MRDKMKGKAVGVVVMSLVILLVTGSRYDDEQNSLLTGHVHNGGSGEYLLSQITILRRMINQQNKVIEDMKVESEKQREVIKQNGGRTSKSVAFYAYMSSSMSNVGAHHTLIFDHVMANIGNAYHPNSGIFIAPVSGVYVFSWSARVNNNGYHAVELTKNGNQVGSVYAWSGKPDASTSTTTIVIQVKERDILSLRTKKKYNNWPLHSNSYGYTSFAGWKLN